MNGKRQRRVPDSPRYSAQFYRLFKNYYPGADELRSGIQHSDAASRSFRTTAQLNCDGLRTVKQDETTTLRPAAQQNTNTMIVPVIVLLLLTALVASDTMTRPEDGER